MLQCFRYVRFRVSDRLRAFQDIRSYVSEYQMDYVRFKVLDTYDSEDQIDYVRFKVLDTYVSGYKIILRKFPLWWIYPSLIDSKSFLFLKT